MKPEYTCRCLENDGKQNEKKMKYDTRAPKAETFSDLGARSHDMQFVKLNV